MSGRKIGEIVRGLRGDLRSLITSVERHANEEWGTLEHTKDIESLLHSASRLCEGLTLVDEATQTRFKSELAQLSGRLSHIQKFEDEMKNLGRVSARATKRLQDTSRSDLHTVRDELQEMYSTLNGCLNNAQIHFSQAQEATRKIKLKLTELTLWRDSGTTSQKKNQSIEQIQASLLKEAELAELAGRLKNATMAHENIAGDYEDWLQSQIAVEQLQTEFSTAEQKIKDGNPDDLGKSLNKIEQLLEVLRAEIARNKELKPQMEIITNAVMKALYNIGYALPKYDDVEKGNNLSPVRIVADPPNTQSKELKKRDGKAKRSFEGTLHIDGRFPFEIFGIENGEENICKQLVNELRKSPDLASHDLEWNMLDWGRASEIDSSLYDELEVDPDYEDPDYESERD